MSGIQLYAENIAANLFIPSQTQGFTFATALSQYQIINNFIPTSLVSSQNAMEFINVNVAGYRFRHLTSNTAIFGNFILETFTMGAIPGIPLLTYNENGPLVLSLTSTNALQLKNNTNVTPLEFYNSTGTNYVGFQAGNLSANTLWTLPTTDSTGTQALVSNGSGILSWNNLSSGTVTSVSGTTGQIHVVNGTSTPVISIDPGYIGQTSITTVGTISTGTWNGSLIPITYGGTNATTASGALTNLGALPIAGGTMTGSLILNADPTNPLGAVTKEYVDAISQGLTFKDSCYAATTVSLTATYLNGVSGVGATLTNTGTLATFSVDGISPAVNARILVKNQSTAFQNGIYTLTTIGSGAIAWVLTRSTDYDQSSEIAPGDFILVDNGTVNASTAWVETATVATIGTNSISFSQFGNMGTVTSVSGTALQIDIANGTSTPIISIDSGYVGQTSIITLGTITTGTWHGVLIGLAYGGSNANLTASNGGIVYSTASAMAILSGTSTANQILLSGASGAPTWSTVTYPATTTINQLLYSSSANVISGLATANNSILVTNSSGVPSLSGTLPFTLPVANGGTGNTTFTAYSVLCSGTTSTGALQNVSGVGASGQVLTSTGSSSLPTWQTISGGGVSSITGTANQITASAATGAVTLSLPTSVIVTTSIKAGNLQLITNTLQSTNTNGNITIAPNGSGNILMLPSGSTGFVGINNSSPAYSLDISGTIRAQRYMGVLSTVPTFVLGPAAGTGGTPNTISGSESSGQFQLTMGISSTGTLLATFTLTSAMSTANYGVLFIAANGNSANEAISIYVTVISTTQFTLNARNTLGAGTYLWNYQIIGN